ncbi:MAG: carboxylating nicotinate-nucleotide diphosphorylase [Armatimonadetes bacterium]|nr:carboxylating nicotinate-nucleotide diphosphorylase [Armatimonadota bacterium]
MQRLPEWPVERQVVAGIVATALSEDVGPGDLTTRLCVPVETRAIGTIIAKKPGVHSGLYVAEEVFRQLDEGISFEAFVAEGDALEVGTVLARLTGPARPILTGERVALNFLQHLCGIATLTKAYAKALEGTGCVLLDTRKTMPGLRALEKAAVRAGGGHNHRLALYDGLLIKDNHVRAAGGVAAAIAAARRGVHPGLRVEVEAQTFEQIEEALEAGADIIMLDNFPPEQVAEAVRRIRGRAKTEASGGITLENVGAYAEAGVDFVSVGALTHSAPALDLSLELVADESATA